MSLVTMGNLAKAIGSSQTQDIRFTQDMAEEPAGIETKFADFFVDEVGPIQNNLGSCAWAVGEQATFSLITTGGASKFVEQILGVDNNWEFQYVQGSNLVTFDGQNGSEFTFTADAEGTFEIELKFQDGFNDFTTNYNVWISQTITISTNPFTVNAFVAQDNDPQYQFTCNTSAGNPSFQWDLGPTVEYTIDSGSLTSQSVTVTFNQNNSEKSIACDVTDPTCGSGSDNFQISIDNAGGA